MKMNVVVLRDSLIPCFLVPSFINESPEAWFEGIQRSLIRAGADVLTRYKDLEAYNLGEYDDTTGLIRLIQPVKLGSFDNVCIPLLKKLGEEPENDA